MSNPAAAYNGAESHRLPTASADSVAEALQQAEAYGSLFAEPEIKLKDGHVMTIPPHPDFGLLDDDALARYEAVLFDRDTNYAREPDVYIPEQRLKDANGNETGVVIPGDTVRGDLKTPYRMLDEHGKEQLLNPPHSVRIVQACLGDEKFAELKAHGGSSADVWNAWSIQSVAVRTKQESDRKSNGSNVAVASVPQANRK